MYEIEITGFVVALVALFCAIDVVKEDALKAALPFIGGGAVILASVLLRGSTTYLYLGVYCVMLSVIMSVNYGRRFNWFFVTFAMLLLLIYFAVLNGIALFFIQMLGVGSTMGFLYIALSNKRKAAKTNIRVELSRDVIQIILGIILLLLLLFFDKENASVVILLLIMAAFFIIAFVYKYKNMVLLKFLRSLEKPRAVYGQGALLLASGTLLILGFVGRQSFVEFGIAVLFFSDSLATICGVYFGKARLAYNRSKSVAGFIAFFVSATVAGYLLIGPLAIPFALVLSFMETADLGLDDNILLAFVLLLLYSLTLL